MSNNLYCVYHHSHFMVLSISLRLCRWILVSQCAKTPPLLYPSFNMTLISNEIVPVMQIRYFLISLTVMLNYNEVWSIRWKYIWGWWVQNRQAVTFLPSLGIYCKKLLTNLLVYKFRWFNHWATYLFKAANIL